MMSCVLRNSGLSSIKFLCATLSHMSIGTRVVIAVAFHEVDNTPHRQTSAEGDNERLQDRNCLIDKFHRVTSLISECGFLKMGKKIEAPSLFCFGQRPCAVHDGASFCFDLSHVIEIEGLCRLDYQPVELVLFNIKSVSFVVVRQQLVFWMLRNVKLVTEKRSHASKLQNTFSAVHHSNFIFRHELFAGFLIVQAIGIVCGSGFRSVIVE